jgi:hypothetical protein
VDHVFRALRARFVLKDVFGLVGEEFCFFTH